jgi:BNR repeat-containing family member/Concanavalin A-like lectin/glucanases superfamily/PKD domain
MTSSLRGALAALLCVLAWAGPAQAQQAPLGGGAWSWFGDPRAVHHNGKTFVGWVDLEGDIKVMSYDHSNGHRVTAVLQARLNQDDHANPSIHVLEDGRLMVFYSRHVGPAMYYRISTNPGDVRSWGEPQMMPSNTAGGFGYTYPNPIRLEAEDRTYLFWRGGNYNPTYSTQADGSETWSQARNLMLNAPERPYVKYASDGDDTIYLAYTNAHPNEFGDVNIYYAEVRGGAIWGAGGNRIAGLSDPPISPAHGDEVFNPPYPTWVHDAAVGPDGPVIVFASFQSATNHLYHYAIWDGGDWVVRNITSAGPSFREDGGSPYYSGGLTLDHEDPSRVYLSRQVGEGLWQVEIRDTDDEGLSWDPPTVISVDEGKNVRPVSPRGLPSVFDDDLRVIWMRGSYPTYETYMTSITATSASDNQAPVADAELSARSGPAPLPVTFDSTSDEPDGTITAWNWDFGDGATASGPEVTHHYGQPGRYFPTLTVVDNGGATSTFVEEVVVGLAAAPVTFTGGTDGSTAHGAIDPENDRTVWYFEYGPTIDYGYRTTTFALNGGDSLQQVSAALPALVPGRLYHYRLVAANSTGTTEGADRVMVGGSAPGSDAYRDALVGTMGLAAYWRLGELSGSSTANEAGGGPASFAGRFVLGQEGVLGRLGNTAATFDGLSGELATPGPALGGSGTMEGWFRWHSGNVLMRDNTGPSGGWLLGLGNNVTLRYRVGGTGFITNVDTDAVRDGSWHHLVATKEGGTAALYLDGARVHSGTGAGSTHASLPWHVMRNGSNAVYTQGEADEVALYSRALSAAEVKQHYDVARRLAGQPLPPETPDPVVDPPAAGTGPGGGVLKPVVPSRRPAGVAYVRRGRLIVRGASGTRNRLTARRRGRAWRIADAAAPLRAGQGCRRLGPRKVSCRAAGVRRIEMHGGAGADTLAVRGRIRALLVGGPGVDRLSGGRLARFRGGPGADRVRRLRP